LKKYLTKNDQNFSTYTRAYTVILFYSHDQHPDWPPSTNTRLPSSSKPNEGQKKIETIVNHLKEKIHQQSEENLSSDENPVRLESDESRKRKYITKLDLILSSERLLRQHVHRSQSHPAPIPQPHCNFQDQPQQRMPVYDHEIRPICQGSQNETYNLKALDLTRTKWSEQVPNWHQSHYNWKGEMPNWHHPQQEHFEDAQMHRHHHSSCPSNYQGTYLGQMMFQPHWIESELYSQNQFHGDALKSLTIFRIDLIFAKNNQTFKYCGLKNWFM
jgi:hypothetical protein